MRNKFLCRLGTNSRELVGASLHAGRLGGDLSSVAPRCRLLGVERERHEQLEVVSRFVGVKTAGQRVRQNVWQKGRSRIWPSQDGRN